MSAILFISSSDLRRNIENLEKNSVTNLRMMVNLGSEVYMQADVPDTQRIFVDVGLGFHVEFTWSEDLNFITQREEKIARVEKKEILAGYYCETLLSSIAVSIKPHRGCPKLVHRYSSKLHTQLESVA